MPPPVRSHAEARETQVGFFRDGFRRKMFAHQIGQPGKVWKEQSKGFPADFSDVTDVTATFEWFSSSRTSSRPYIRSIQ